MLMVNDSWELGPWNMWKCLSKYARKCYGFPRAHLPFLPHNMARPPKNMFATALRVSPTKNVRKNRPRHVMWQDRLLHCVVFTKTSEEFAPHYLAEIRHDMRQTTTLYAIDDGLSH